MDEWGIYFCSQDPRLSPVFNKTLQLETLLKHPYVALIGAIIGQKIRYKTARTLRSKIYSRLGTNFTPTQFQQLTNQELKDIGLSPLQICYCPGINKKKCVCLEQQNVTLETWKTSSLDTKKSYLSTHSMIQKESSALTHGTKFHS